jgi:hypothetical protein
MIQYSCSLSCYGCLSMSDNPKQGGVSIAEGEEWLAAWSQKVDPYTIILSGGEPLLNTDLDQWIRKTRQYFPNSTIKLTTNGVHLKDSNIIPLLMEVGNAVYEISYHLTGPTGEMIEKELIKRAMAISNEWHVLNNPLKSVPLSLTLNTVTVQLTMFEQFVKPYHGKLGLIRPWRSNGKEASHAVCGAPKNPILFKNRLYKCPPIANLRDTLELYDLQYNADWQEYLKYKGFGLDDDLTAFIADVGKPNKICTMCSADNRAVVEHYEPAMVSIPIYNAPE